MSIKRICHTRTAVLLLTCLGLPLFSAGTLAQLRVAEVADAQAIARLYSAAFDRYPDPDGLNFWLYSWTLDKSFLDIAEEFYQSPEFTESYGPLTDRQFVDQLYFNVLGRNGDTRGVDFWLSQLASGASRASVLLGFSQSPENVANTDLAFSGIELFNGGLEGPFFNFRSGDPRDYDFHPSPVRVNTPLRFSAIAAGFSHNCAIATTGDTYCWGYNKYDQLGSTEPTRDCGAFSCSGTPVLVAGGHKFKQLVAGRRHSCGLELSGAAWCWGFGANGQLGAGQGSSSRVPVPVAGGLTFGTLAANANAASTCGLTATGEAWCWGSNRSGSLGIGTDAGAVFLPTQVMTSVRFLSIDIGDGAACGVSTDGDAYCWGDNTQGQLGVGSAGVDGGLAGSNSPLAVQGGEKFIQVATDGLHACAPRGTGTLFCWGVDFGSIAYLRNFPGHDLFGTYYHALPVVMQDVNGVPWGSSTGSPWTSISVGFGQTCASTQTGALECWGQETTGSAPGYDNYFWSPVSISTDQVFAGFASGGRHDCFIRSDGIAFCSGRNNWGQLGHAPAPLPHEL